MNTGTPGPRVSVVMIFLNGMPFIREAIDSVLAQSFDDLELLLCDDGSTDASTALARACADRDPGRIRYLEHPGHANRGMSATRNLGISHARGEFVALLDCDDVWARDKLAEQVAIMDAHPELGMVCGAARYWRSWEGGIDTVARSGHVADRVVSPPEATLALYPLGRATSPCPSDLLLRRDVLLRLGGFEEHFTGARQMYEDQGFLAKLYLAAPVYFADRIWVDYRQHDASCVAQVKGAGRYREVRGYFLRWLDGYVAAAPPALRAAVAPALERALRPYRHPVLFVLADVGAWINRIARGVARRAARVAALRPRIT